MKNLMMISLIIFYSCSAASYLESHPNELKDVEQVGEDSVKLLEDVVEGK